MVESVLPRNVANSPAPPQDRDECGRLKVSYMTRPEQLIGQLPCADRLLDFHRLLASLQYGEKPDYGRMYGLLQECVTLTDQAGGVRAVQLHCPLIHHYLSPGDVGDDENDNYSAAVDAAAPSTWRALIIKPRRIGERKTGSHNIPTDEEVDSLIDKGQVYVMRFDCGLDNFRSKHVRT